MGFNHIHILRQVPSTRCSRATCCPRHGVVLPAETFVMRKRLLTLPLAKLKQNAEEILKIYELFIYGDIHFITTHFVEICQNRDTTT